MQTPDPLLAQRILGQMAREWGMTQVARRAGLSRENLYRAVSGTRDAYFSTVVRALHGMGYVLRAEKNGGAR